MKRYFIIGTDTDCGKTYITAKLVNYFANSAAIKPVASGGFVIEINLLVPMLSTCNNTVI